MQNALNWNMGFNMRLYAYNATKGIQYPSRYYLNISKREMIKRYREVNKLKGKRGYTFVFAI